MKEDASSEMRGQSASGRSGFMGKCFECGQRGHKRDQCKRKMNHSGGDQFVFSVSSRADYERTCFLDSGFLKPTEGRLDVFVANGARLEVRGVGDVRFGVGGGKTVVVTGVLYVPELDHKLLSVPTLAAKGAQVEFQPDSCVIKRNGEVVVRGERASKLYRVVFQQPKVASVIVALAATTADGRLRHARLGHVRSERVSRLQHVAEGAPIVPEESDSSVREGCARGKTTVAQFAYTSGSVMKTGPALEIVHSDLMGPMETVSKGGARYVLVFMDDWSRFAQVYLLKAKSEVQEVQGAGGGADRSEASLNPFRQRVRVRQSCVEQVLRKQWHRLPEERAVLTAAEWAGRADEPHSRRDGSLDAVLSACG
ncbi:hypothetical protein PybrP1_005644 [[Pythium] brassicae (nom. inval.)]|nr:hypothetical protein PybrP1_005644 [[Pythium] brassicae (nom. inval.)]